MKTASKIDNQPIAIDAIKDYLLELQNNICTLLETEDGHATFKEDRWQFHEKGGGVSRVLTGGNVIEKAGVNFSHVLGSQLPQAATLKRPLLANASFEALGVSVVVHPDNPYVPTSHMNVRFIAVETTEGVYWWFGGGYDLTPYYGFKEDCIHWHTTAKAACDPFGLEIYPKFKTWCDDYFYLKHRQEPRGIGGLFFDDLNQWSFERCFEFQRAIGDSYLKAYQPIIHKRQSHPFGEREKAFQHYRRGRYVEFNLLYDRGTLFGLQSDGRTESILMSLPPMVSWSYNWQPLPGSKEAELYTDFLQPLDWV